MNRKEWQAIEDARDLLRLGDTATTGEIKRAYHRLCKRFHPDKSGRSDGGQSEQIYRITAAYELLQQYCREFRFPLKPGVGDLDDAEEWWMERFGQDPVWSDRKRRG